MTDPQRRLLARAAMFRAAGRLDVADALERVHQAGRMTYGEPIMEPETHEPHDPAPPRCPCCGCDVFDHSGPQPRCTGCNAVPSGDQAGSCCGD